MKTCRLLLDSCIAGRALGELGQAGHDVIWAGEWETDPGDEEILARAQVEGRILVTLDKDFGELVFVRGRPHAGILRIVNFGSRDQARVCQQVLTSYGEELAAGAVITVEPGRVRVRSRT